MVACAAADRVVATPVVSRIVIEPDSAFLRGGRSAQFAAILYGETGTVVNGGAVWSVDDTTKGTVSRTGMVSARAPGLVTVTAQSGPVSATAHVVVGLTGTFTLRRVNGTAVPGSVPVPVACGDGQGGNVVAHSGESLFSPSGATAGEALDIEVDCSNSSSRYYGSMPDAMYWFVDDAIELIPSCCGTPPSPIFGPARLDADTLTLRWKPDLVDSLTLVYVRS